MKQIFFRISKWTGEFIVYSSSFIVFLCVSCSDIYDNIKDFSVEEIVYPAHYDTIFGSPGYERVEIDLYKMGRVPSSLVRLGKATKTIIEWDSISLRYDSLFSWVNLTGLTQPKLYRFKIYTTDDNFEDRSTPLEIALVPYTSFDREALAVPTPSMITKSDFLVINWNGGLTSEVMEFRGLTYSYANKNGDSITGTKWYTPEFYLKGLEKNTETAVKVRYWVTPKLDGQTILDSIYFDQEMTVEFGDAAVIDFVISPSRIGLAKGTQKVATPSLEYGLSWKSSNTSVATVSSIGVITARNPGSATVAVTTEAVDYPATAEVIVTDVSAIPAGGRLTGMWTFEDGNDLVKPSIGLDLEASDIGNGFSSIVGPSNTKAVRASSNSYYAVNHQMSANGGGANVNEYTLMMDIRGSDADFTNWVSLFNTHENNGGEGVLWIDGAGHIGDNYLGGYSTAVLSPNRWYRLVVAAKLGESFSVYVNGSPFWSASSNIEVDGLMSLLPKAFYIGYDGAGYRSPDIAEFRIWNTRLTDEQIKSLGGL
jgi:hypothetical protein